MDMIYYVDEDGNGEYVITEETLRKKLQEAEKEYEVAGEEAEYNVHKNFLYVKIKVLKELLGDINETENNKIEWIESERTKWMEKMKKYRGNSNE